MIGALRPERIALYSYAHLPERFKPQRRIETAALPDAGQRRSRCWRRRSTRLGERRLRLHRHGPFRAARRCARASPSAQGRLHRNFQGYSTRPDCDLIGLGVSAISRIGDTYSQNAKTLEAYGAAIAAGRFATERGIALDPDDVLTRSVIMALMCQGEVDLIAVARRHGIDGAERFRPELAALAPLAASRLVRVGAGRVEVTPLGWYFVRSIAMVFDRRLQADRQRGRYSRVL